MKLCLVAALGLSTGCAASLYQDYTVSVEGFSPDEQTMVFDGVHRWVYAVGDGLTITRAATCVNQANAICIYPKRLASLLGVTERRYNFISGDPPIKIYLDTIDYVWRPEALSHVTQHEVGHALGLNHTGKGTVMYSSSATNAVVQPDAAQNVTCADVAQFGELRGFHATCSEAK